MVVFATVIPMTILAQYFHRSNLIFPEAAALTIGTWGGEAHAWSRSKVKLALLPPLAATVGVLLNLLHVPTIISFTLLVALIPIALDLIDSALIPTISAGALPTLFHITSPWFLAVVFAIAVALSFGLYLGERFVAWSSSKGVDQTRIETRGEVDGVTESGVAFDLVNEYADGALVANREQDDIDEDLCKSSVTRRRVLIWFIVLSMIWTLTTWWWLPHSALAPPLLVSFYEWLKSSNRTTPRYLKRWASITSGIVIGTIVHQGVDNFATAALIAIALTFAFMTLLHEIHPPTLAIALLPLIFPATIAYERAFDVSLTVAVLYGLGLYLPKLIRHKSWTIDPINS
jgi:hypothetical protein